MNLLRNSKKTGTPSTTLADLRQHLGLNRRQLADAMSANEPAVMTNERSHDPQVSTVRRYIEALGTATKQDASLEVTAVIGDNHYPITFPLPTKGTAMTTATLTPTDTTTPRRIATPWRLRAWDDPQLEQRFLNESVISISADEIGDVTKWPGDDEMRRRLREATDALGQNRGQQAIGMFVRYWDDFRNQMKPGDAVVVPMLGRRAAIGRIDSDYRYTPPAAEREPKMRHLRDVTWLRTVDRADLPNDIRKVVNAPGTICRINAPGATDWLL